MEKSPMFAIRNWSAIIVRHDTQRLNWMMRFIPCSWTKNPIPFHSTWYKWLRIEWINKVHNISNWILLLLLMTKRWLLNNHGLPPPQSRRLAILLSRQKPPQPGAAKTYFQQWSLISVAVAKRRNFRIGKKSSTSRNDWKRLTPWLNSITDLYLQFPPYREYHSRLSRVDCGLWLPARATADD